MKKRMKMKKYAEGGMSDDDEGYDAYTTSVTDDEGEVLYEKPESKYTEPKKTAKPAAKPAAKPSASRMSARQTKAMEYLGYDQASQNKNLDAPTRRDMLRRREIAKRELESMKDGMKRGGAVKSSSASRRADGIAQRGKTKGRMI